MRSSRFKIFAGVLLAAAAAFLTYTSVLDCTTVGGYEDIAVNAFSLRAGHARRFCYKDDAGRKLRFILARGNDGKIRSVFDACRQCFTFHRGYRIVNGEMICRVCGNHYPLDHMTEGKASCVPVTLSHQDDSGVVHVKTADLKAGSALF